MPLQFIKRIESHATKTAGQIQTSIRSSVFDYIGSLEDAEQSPTQSERSEEKEPPQKHMAADGLRGPNHLVKRRPIPRQYVLFHLPMILKKSKTWSGSPTPPLQPSPQVFNHRKETRTLTRLTVHSSCSGRQETHNRVTCHSLINEC